MATLKVRCPECDAAVRLTVEPVDRPTEFTVACPKCGAEFLAEAPPEVSRKSPTGKSSRRRDDENRPRRKKSAAGPNPALLYGGIAGGVLVLGGIVAAVVLLGGPKDHQQAKSDPPAKVEPPEPPPAQSRPPQPKQNPPGPKAKDDAKKPKDEPKNEPPKAIPGLPPLPAPPRVRLAATGATDGKLEASIEKPVPFIPLTPDEDPFIRARRFAPDGPVPPLPKLPTTNRPLLTLDSGGHSAFISKVFITPASDQVITVSEDKAVRIWDIKTGEPTHTIRLPAGTGKEGSLLAAALSPDGKRLAVAGFPLRTVRPGGVPIFIIDVQSGSLSRSIASARDTVSSLDYSSDGSRLAVGCLNGSIQIFNAGTGAVVGQLDRAHGGSILQVRYSPAQDRVFATLGADGAVKMWDLANSTRNHVLDVSAIKPNSISWTGTGRGLAIGGESGEIVLFSVQNGKAYKTLPRQVINGSTAEINQLQFLKGDREILCGGIARGAGGWASIVSADTGVAKVRFGAHTNTVFAVNASADGLRAVSSGGNQHETYVWSTATGKIVSRLCGSGKGIWAVAWAKDGRSVAWGTSNKRDRDGHAPLESAFRFDDFGTAGRPDDIKFQQSLTADKDHGARRISQTEVVLEPQGGSGKGILFTLPHQEPIYSVSVLPGQKRVAICGAETLATVDPTSGRIIRKFVGHTGNILSAAPSPDGRYFVTGSIDQTIRVWNPDFEEPLLSIFVADREWIAWTPQGYYACSPHGEGLIAWQVNTTALKLPQILPAARFRPSMYQPALIKYLIPAGNLPLAMAMARKFDKALVETTTVADIVPPEVNIDAQTEAEVVIEEGTYVVKATARGSTRYPVISMRLLVDGRPYQGAAGTKTFDKPGAASEASWNVELAPGPHSLAVIAETGVSKSISKVSLVRRKGEPPKPNLYVLAMGVSKYTGGVNSLNFAASDATLIARAFQERSKGVFAKIEVHILTDSQATKQGMRDGLDWLKARMTAMDVGIVSFSGHGTRDAFGRFSLVPSDASAADIIGSCMSGEEFKSRLDRMPGRLVAILDACHSGMVAGSETPRADNLVRDLAAEDSGVIVMCSSLGRETSLEDLRTRAGYFTLGLVEGLTELGDVDEDGIINIHELDMYANARVRQLSGGKQNSTLGRPAAIRPFPIARIDKPSAVPPPMQKN